jgi:hypothetical protein
VGPEVRTALAVPVAVVDPADVAAVAAHELLREDEESQTHG